MENDIKQQANNKSLGDLSFDDVRKDHLNKARAYSNDSKYDLMPEMFDGFFMTSCSIKLLKTLNAMRNDKSLCDFEIKCENDSFYCHKCLLIATSDYFKVMLTGSMQQTNQTCVDFANFHTSSNAIKSILDFIYTGFIQINSENISDILATASYLQVHEILHLCSSFLVENLTEENFVSTFKLVDLYSLHELTDSIEDFLINNFTLIYEKCGDKFNELSYEQIKFVLKCDMLHALHELKLFVLVANWLQHSVERLEHAPELIESINFFSMRVEDLIDCVETFEFMKSIPECSICLMNAYRYFALPFNRQALVNIDDKRDRLHCKEMLVAVGEQNLFVLNEKKNEWETICSAPLTGNYRKLHISSLHSASILLNAALPIKAYPFSVQNINNYLYVLGSWHSESEEYKLCYRFSPKTLEWTSLAPFLNDRSRFSVANIDNFIYVFSGFEGFKKTNRNFLKSIDRYSIKDNTWETFLVDGPMISGSSACAFENLIYFGGGKNTSWTKLSDFYVLDIKKKTIDKKASMLSPRTNHQLYLVEESIYSLGGFDDLGNGILTVEAYNIKMNQWSKISSMPGLTTKTWPQSLGLIRDRFYISAFHTTGSFKIIQKGYFYDVVSKQWCQAPVICEKARYSLTCNLCFTSIAFDKNGILIRVKSTT